MFPFVNFPDHQCSCKQLKFETFIVSSWHNPKNIPFSERQLTAFTCPYFRSTRFLASMESFWKASRINPTLGFLEEILCLHLIIAAGFGLFIRPAIFHQSECHICRWMRCIWKTITSMQAPFALVPGPRLATHLSWLCLWTLLPLHCTRAYSQTTLTCNERYL